MFEWLQGLTESAHPALQWAVVALAGAIPFVESYFGSVLGILAGVNPVVAILAAIIGNIVSMWIFVMVAARTRAATKADQKELTPRRARLKERFDKWGVVGVSLLGQTLLPSQITSAAMVGFGASRSRVILWQIISIILWGTVFGVLAALGINFLGG